MSIDKNQIILTYLLSIKNNQRSNRIVKLSEINFEKNTKRTKYSDYEKQELIQQTGATDSIISPKNN